MQRREFMGALGATAIAGSLAGCASTGSHASGAKVVVIGGGFGGATAAKYVRAWSHHAIDVTLVEPNANFISCPLSNLVLGGSKRIEDLTVSYDNLTKRHGIKVVHDIATVIDPQKRTVTLASGTVLPYDRLILSPGIDFLLDEIPGLKQPGASDRILHAWKAGPQTVALRRQLEAMRDGGTVAISIPVAPYRCPPGPYERACQIAFYLKQAKPKSKLLILDANPEVTSKGALFKKEWAKYGDMIEYRNQHKAVDVDVATQTLKFEVHDDVKADVLNVIPPQSAGSIAVRTGLATANKRWCEVDFLTFESTVAPNIHVLGDAIQIAPGMPKSGHMANQHAKVAAAAVVSLLSGRPVDAQPLYNNTCYSFTTDREVMHVASVHRYDAEKKTMVTVDGSGGLSPAPNVLEATYALNWANTIWADALA